MGSSSHRPVQSLASRLKENMEKLTEERDQRTAAENREKEQNKRLQRQLRDTKEEMGELARKEAEASRKKHELVIPPAPRPTGHKAPGQQPSEKLLSTHLTTGLVGEGCTITWFRESKEEDMSRGQSKEPCSQARGQGDTRTPIRQGQAPTAQQPQSREGSVGSWWHPRSCFPARRGLKWLFLKQLDERLALLWTGLPPLPSRRWIWRVWKLQTRACRLI